MQSVKMHLDGRSVRGHHARGPATRATAQRAPHGSSPRSGAGRPAPCPHTHLVGNARQRCWREETQAGIAQLRHRIVAANKGRAERPGCAGSTTLTAVIPLPEQSAVDPPFFACVGHPLLRVQTAQPRIKPENFRFVFALQAFSMATRGEGGVFPCLRRRAPPPQANAL